MKKLIQIESAGPRHLRLRVQSPVLVDDEVRIEVNEQEVFEREFPSIAKVLAAQGSFGSAGNALSFLRETAMTDEDGDLCQKLFDIRFYGDPAMRLGRMAFSWPNAVIAAHEMAEQWIVERAQDSVKAREEALTVNDSSG